MKIFWFLISIFFVGSLGAVDMEIKTLAGELFIIQADEEQGLTGIHEQIEMLYGVPLEQQKLYFGEDDGDIKAMSVDFMITMVNHDREKEKLSSTPIPRDFNADVAPQEKEDIRYIVTTLANKPTAKLLFYKTSLDAAGDRVNHVHPLRFLETIFNDEEMKVGMHNIVKKSWVWKEFMKGLGESLSEEKGRDNLTTEQIEFFANAVELKPSLITGSLNANRWEEFVVLLIKNIPRKGDHNKYNM